MAYKSARDNAHFQEKELIFFHKHTHLVCFPYSLTTIFNRMVSYKTKNIFSKSMSLNKGQFKSKIKIGIRMA